MRRVFVALVLLAACGSSQVKGPAWPAPSTTAEDGGESLDPRPSAKYAAAVEKSAEPEPEKKDSDEEPTVAAEDEESEDTPEATPAAAQSPDDEELMTEEIVIEIEEE